MGRNTRHRLLTNGLHSCFDSPCRCRTGGYRTGGCRTYNGGYCCRYNSRYRRRRIFGLRRIFVGVIGVVRVVCIVCVIHIVRVICLVHIVHVIRVVHVVRIIRAAHAIRYVIGYPDAAILFGGHSGHGVLEGGFCRCRLFYTHLKQPQDDNWKQQAGTQQHTA